MKPIEPDRLALIESAGNDRFRQLIALCASSRERRKRHRSVIEGAKLIQSYLDSSVGRNQGLVAVYLPQRGLTDRIVLGALRRHAGTVTVLADNLFKQASQMAVSAGPIAIINTPQQGLPNRLEHDFVYLDRVQDPGNIGTILRTCAAAGVKDVITARGTAYCWAPKVLRAAMGAHFVLRIIESVEPAELYAHISPDIDLRVLQSPRNNRHVSDLYRADLTPVAGWFFGSEGSGLRPELIEFANQRLSIDQDPSVESLNVAAAVAISLFEARRQRART